MRRLSVAVTLCISTGMGSAGCDSAPKDPVGSVTPETSTPPKKPGPMVAGRAPPSQPAAKTVAWTHVDGDDAQAQVVAAAAGAKGLPVVYVGATWCGPCKVYKKSLDDPKMVQAHRPVHIIELDADAHATALQSLGITPKGVPHWEMMDKTGASVGRSIDGSAWGENTVENMAAALGQFFTAG